MVSPVLKDVPLQGSDQAGVMSLLVRILAEQGQGVRMLFYDWNMGLELDSQSLLRGQVGTS